MKENITLDMLTKDSVSVKIQQIMMQDNKEYEIGQPHRKAYVNSVRGRKEMQDEVSEPYQSVIMLMWGDNPSVDETVRHSD